MTEIRKNSRSTGRSTSGALIRVAPDRHTPGLIWIAVLLCLLVPLALILAFNQTISLGIALVCVTMVLSGLLFATSVFRNERKPHMMIFGLYSYIFLGLAPLVQMLIGVWPPTTPAIDESLLVTSSLVAIIGIVAALFGAAIKQLVSRCETDRIREIDPIRLVVMTLLAMVITIYYINSIGIVSLFESRATLVAIKSLVWPNRTMAILVSSFATMPLLVSTVGWLLWSQSTQGRNAWLVRTFAGTLAVATLLIINPMSSPRYVVGTALAAIAIGLGGMRTIRRYRVFAITCLLGLVTIFPLADAFRVSTDAPSFKSAGVLNGLVTADFDSYSQLVNTIEFVNANEQQHGRQITGAVLFWIPRTMWPDKPIDTGTLVGLYKGYSFTNLSSPIWAELYIDGQWISLVIGMLALGYILSVLDTRFDHQIGQFKNPTIMGCIGPLYLLIVLRGSLLNAFSFLIVAVMCARFVERQQNIQADRIPDREVIRR